jgi:hypothetical protein
MDATHIKTKFERLGARAKIRPLVQNRWQPEPRRVVIDVRHDRHGEFFDIQAVRSRERGKRGKRSKRLRRKTDVFIRQGEWYFIPAPDVQVNEKLILPREPITRGTRSKPHMCEELYRDGGTTVYVCDRHPNGLTVDEYRALLKADPAAAKWRRRTMARNPVVYVRGKVWHPDHATIRLAGWRRVEMNTEQRSRAMASVAFLD